MRFLSLFSGIEAASVAWLPLGWECVGFSEIAPFQCEVLKHHYPKTPNLGDITKITKEMLDALGPVDLLVGGFPCQDVSVAGQRAGFEDADGERTRSGLFHEAMRVVDLVKPRWTVIENVPGLLSSRQGRDFATVVAALAGCDFDAPEKGWEASGVVAGPSGLVEWATLDAQFFGLAQRRKRVFLVRDTGDWARRGPVLLERESLLRNFEASREARTHVAHCVAAGAGGGKFGSGRDGQDDFVIGGIDDGTGRGVSRALANVGGGNDPGANKGATLVVAAPLCSNGKAAGSATQQDAESGMLVTHSLRAEGFDASEDGTGRGTPITVVPLTRGADSRGKGGYSGRRQEDDVNLAVSVLPFDPVQVTSDKNYSSPKPGDPCHPLAVGSAHQATIAFTQNQREEVRDLRDLSGAVKAPGTHEQTFVAVIPIQSDASRDGVNRVPGPDAEGRVRLRDAGIGVGENGDPAYTMQAGSPGAIAFHVTQDPISGEISPAISAENQQGCGTIGVQNRMGVRRLTPRECCRLQGFPDDYLDIPYRGKPAADGPKYQALGNSMAVPCMAWIGRQIEEVERLFPTDTKVVEDRRFLW